MRVLALTCLALLGCTGSHRPVSKGISAVPKERRPNRSTEHKIEGAPWWTGSSRWDGAPLSTRPGIKWSVSVGGPVVHPVRSDGDTVFVVSSGDVVAVNRIGESLWRADIQASGPIGTGDLGVLVPTAQGAMQILDRETGALRESHTSNGPIRTAPLALGPAVGWVDAEGRLTTTSGAFEVVVEGPVSGAATDGDLMVVGNRAGEVIATRTTERVWRAVVPGPVVGHPALDTNRAYVAFGASGGRRGGISAIDVQTGSTVWETRLRSEPASPPAVGLHIIVPDKKSELIALDRDHGGIRWRAPSSATFSIQPAVQADAIYAARHDGRLVRIDMADGGTVWSLDLESAITGGMSHFSGVIYLGTADGRVIALEEQ